MIQPTTYNKPQNCRQGNVPYSNCSKRVDSCLAMLTFHWTDACLRQNPVVKCVSRCVGHGKNGGKIGKAKGCTDILGNRGPTQKAKDLPTPMVPTKLRHVEVNTQAHDRSCPSSLGALGRKARVRPALTVTRHRKSSEGCPRERAAPSRQRLKKQEPDDGAEKGCIIFLPSAEACTPCFV